MSDDLYTLEIAASQVEAANCGYRRGHLVDHALTWANMRSSEEDMEAARCSFCSSTTGPFSRVEGVFAVLMCVDCLATRGHGTGPYPAMTRAEMRSGLDLLPTWVLETKAAANRQVIAFMR